MQPQFLDRRLRRFFELKRRVLRFAGSYAESHNTEDDDGSGVGGRVCEGVARGYGSSSEQLRQHRQKKPESQVHIRFSRKIGAGKGDLSHAAEAELREDRSQQAQDYEVRRGRPPWPQSQKEQRHACPDRGHADHEHGAAASRQAARSTAHRGNAKHPVGAQVERSASTTRDPNTQKHNITMLDPSIGTLT